MKQFIASLSSSGSGEVIPPPAQTDTVLLFDYATLSLPSGWVNNGFIDTGNGLAASGTGSMATTVYDGTERLLMNAEHEITIKLDNLTTRMALGFHKQTGIGARGLVFTIDWANSLLKYGFVPATGTNEPPVVGSTAISNVSPVIGNTYKLQVYVLRGVLRLRLIDVATGLYDEINASGDIAMMRGFTSVFHFLGGFTLLNYKMTALNKSNPKVGWFGDSITEGEGGQVPTGQYLDGYAHKAALASDNAFVCAQGGAKTLDMLQQTTWLYDNFPLMIPTYTVLYIGVNNIYVAGSFEASYAPTIAKIVERGSIPVLVYISPSNPAVGRQYMVDGYNAIIATYAGTYDIINAAFVLSDNNDSQTWNPLYTADNLHPNNAGHLVLYNEIVANHGYLITP